MVISQQIETLLQAPGIGLLAVWGGRGIMSFLFIYLQALWHARYVIYTPRIHWNGAHSAQFCSAWFYDNTQIGSLVQLSQKITLLAINLY